jgi:hypothetical protein
LPSGEFISALQVRNRDGDGLSKNISRKGPRNCRSLGCARDDKGESDGSIESGCWKTERNRYRVDALPRTHDALPRTHYPVSTHYPDRSQVVPALSVPALPTPFFCHQLLLFTSFTSRSMSRCSYALLNAGCHQPCIISLVLHLFDPPWYLI